MTIKQTLMVVPLLIVAWLSVLVTVTLVSDKAPALVVLFPSDTLTKSLPDGVAVLGASPYTLTLQSDAPHLAAMLYAQGARLVLPSGLRGCNG